MDVLSIYLLTWNVVATDPPTQAEIESLFDGKADLVAIGLQEVKSQPQNILSDTLYEDSWTNSFRDVLAEKNYVKIHTIRLLGILLSVFSKKSHIASIRDIEASFTRTGLNGFWGNKGAVSIRFNFNGNSVCIVNSHLPAHDNMIANRISDYFTVVNNHAFQKDKIRTILDHDFVFWIGDLNFRLEVGSFETNEIIDHVQQKKFSPLLQRDELILAIKNRAAFRGFSEGNITFAPTYKFLVGTHEYDRKRRPAWTDRVLFKAYNWDDNDDKSMRNSEISCKRYSSHANQIVSDHKPVSALLEVKIKEGEIQMVIFDKIKSWIAGSEGRIVYSLLPNVAPNNWQWVAFFREDFSSLGEYVSFVWSSQEAVPGRSATYQLTVPGDILCIPGRYVAAYMSEVQPYHVMGLSPVFEVKEYLEQRQEL